MTRPLYARFFILVFGSLLSTLLHAQPGIVNTIAGGGTSTAEGASALSASIAPKFITMSPSGDIYFSSNNTIKKLLASNNRIYTVAGNGLEGYSGDGGAATLASISVRGICVDGPGNLYICDKANSVIRKVSATTGIISTLPVGYLYFPTGVVADDFGNLYISNVGGGAEAAIKFNLATSVSTIALAGPPFAFDIARDIYGDVYVRCSDSLWKINSVTGAVSSFFGLGGSVGDETNFALNSYGVAYLTYGSGVLSQRDINTGSAMPLGSYGSGSYPDNVNGVPISKVNNSPPDVCVGTDGDVYYTNFETIRKISCHAPGVSGKYGYFIAGLEKRCAGPDFSIIMPSYLPGINVVTSYGDGGSDTTNILPALSSGFAKLQHSYVASGSYTIRHMLYNGTVFLDSASYTFYYDFCRVLPVKLFYDANFNCMQETVTEPFVTIPQTVVVDSNNVSVDTICILSGFNYDAYGKHGDIYSFRVNGAGGLFVNCPATGEIFDTLSPTIFTQPVKYFGLSCSSSSAFDYSVHATARARRHELLASVLVSNPYCVTPPAELSVSTSPKFEYDGASPIPSVYSANYLSWNLAGATPFAGLAPKIYTVNMQTSGPLYSPGDTVKSSYTIFPSSGDLNPVNNIVIRVDTVRSSFDPNYIEVVPSGCISKYATELTYTVAFENTGNDTAHNIYVLDTIPYMLDLSTFRPIASSAAMNIHQYKDGPYNVIKFDFPDIMLPDSSHHGLCHGMFVYKIKTRSGMLVNTEISNRVGIYFDDNEVVLTNSAYNKIGCPGYNAVDMGLAKLSTSIHLFPNPATHELTITTGQSSFTALIITNAVGQQVLQQSMTGTQENVNVKQLPAGVYYVNLRGEQGSEVRKFVKW